MMRHRWTKSQIIIQEFEKKEDDDIVLWKLAKFGAREVDLRKWKNLKQTRCLYNNRQTYTMYESPILFRLHCITNIKTST